MLAKKTEGIRRLISGVLTPDLIRQKEGFPRPMITFLKCFFNKDLIGVEIGVDYGFNAESILKTLKIKKLFLVDPYKPYMQNGVLEKTSIRRFLFAKTKLARFKAKIEFFRMTSFKASGLIPNDLDFVYIDGNHAYDFVKEDIGLYYPKIKKGGVLGGHDFGLHSQGVLNAVWEFKTDNRLDLNGEKIDWWVIKN